MTKTFVVIVTKREGQRREYTHKNPYSIVAKDNVLRLDCHFLNSRGQVCGYHGASYPKADVREIIFKDANS